MPFNNSKKIFLEVLEMINSQITVYGRTLPNRVVFQPMEGCDCKANGGIDELTRRRYIRFAQSGAAIIWFEATAVCEEGRSNPRQAWLTDETLPSFKSLVSEMKSVSRGIYGYEPLIIIQLNHSGRYAKPSGKPEPKIVYRNEVLEKGKEEQPYEILTDEKIDEIPAMYAKSAALAVKAGFDGIDVKCCHGYFINEFLSAYNREGKYGGSFENRTRLYFDCIDAVKSVIPEDVFVTTRLSGFDGFDYPYGYGCSVNMEIDFEEPKKIISKLLERGIELINITIGNPYVIPHVNRPFAGGPENGEIGVERVRFVTNELQQAFPQAKIIMSALTYPGVRAIDYANECLESGSCTMVGFGRMTFAYPQFFQDYLTTGTLDPKKVCIKCGNCSKMMRSGAVAGCPVRDREIYMPIFKKAMESVK